MRCVFTAGVLDCLMQEGIAFPYTIAVSGGSINGLSYMSGQQGRSRDLMIEYMRRTRYIGPMNSLRCGSFIDFNQIFRLYDEVGIPFDFEAYRRHPGRFVVVTTDCLRGTPYYGEERDDLQRLYRLCEASSSLPLLCPRVEGCPKGREGLSEMSSQRQMVIPTAFWNTSLGGNRITFATNK